MIDCSPFKISATALILVLIFLSTLPRNDCLPLPPSANGVTKYTVLDSSYSRRALLNDNSFENIHQQLNPYESQLKGSAKKLLEIQDSSVSLKPNGKALRKAASALAKMKIISAIHPRLSAVLLPESGEEILPPQQPIKSVKYRSSPLQGTEQHDREVLGLTAQSQSINPDSSGIQHTELKTHSENFERQDTSSEMTSDTHHTSLEPRGSSNAFQSHEEVPTRSVVMVSPSSDSSIPLRAMERPRKEDVSSSAVQRNGNDIRTNDSAKALTQSVSEKTQLKKPNDSQDDEAFPELTSWRAFLEWAKNRVSGLLNGKPTLRKHFGNGGNNGMNLVYSEEDIKQLANDIVDVIRERSYQTYKQREYLRKTGKRNEDVPTSRELATGTTTQGPMYLMKSRLFVTPELLSDAVKASTTKLLISKKLSNGLRDNSAILKQNPMTGHTSENSIPGLGQM